MHEQKKKKIAQTNYEQAFWNDFSIMIALLGISLVVMGFGFIREDAFLILAFGGLSIIILILAIITTIIFNIYKRRQHRCNRHKD